jgi:predicted NUDIX family NTP pyrophosphohydrolase
LTGVTGAGLVLYRTRGAGVEVFLVHPGGPFWRNKDEGAWSIPKGIHGPEEDPLDAARREFTEETGFTAEGPFTPLGTFKLRPGKIVTAFAAEGDCEPEDLVSNTCMVEWPPKSGRLLEIPEVDRGAWFGKDAALTKIAKGQRALILAFYEDIIQRRPERARAPIPSTQRRIARTAAQAPVPRCGRGQR